MLEMNMEISEIFGWRDGILGCEAVDSVDVLKKNKSNFALVIISPILISLHGTSPIPFQGRAQYHHT
jgi:hypothetical protein